MLSTGLLTHVKAFLTFNSLFLSLSVLPQCSFDLINRDLCTLTIRWLGLMRLSVIAPVSQNKAISTLADWGRRSTWSRSIWLIWFACSSRVSMGCDQKRTAPATCGSFSTAEEEAVWGCGESWNSLPWTVCLLGLCFWNKPLTSNMSVCFLFVGVFGKITSNQNWGHQLKLSPVGFCFDSDLSDESLSGLRFVFWDFCFVLFWGFLSKRGLMAIYT